MFGFIRGHSRAVFRWGLAALLALIVAVTAGEGWRLTHTDFEGETLALRRVERERAVMTDRAGGEAELTGPGGVPVVGRESVLTYAGRTIRRRFDESDFAYVYTFSDGSERRLPIVEVTTGPSAARASDALTDAQRAELALFRTMQGYLADGSPVGRCVGKGLLAAALTAFGLALMCFPERAWRIQTAFTVKGGEPTDWAILSNQLGGLLLVAVSIVLAAIPL